jgi:hypothetical protein
MHQLLCTFVVSGNEFGIFELCYVFVCCMFDVSGVEFDKVCALVPVVAHTK